MHEVPNATNTAGIVGMVYGRDGGGDLALAYTMHVSARIGFL